MYAHDATARPRVSSRLAPQLPARIGPTPASSGSASPTPAGSRPDSPTKKPATRRPVGAGLLDTVAEVRPVAPSAVPDLAAQVQPQPQAQSPPPLPAPRATSPLPTSFTMSSSPITTSRPRALEAPTSLSPTHAIASGSTTSSAASAAPSTRTTASAAAFTAIGRSGIRRARKFVAHWSDGSTATSTDRRALGSSVIPSDSLLESYRLRGVQLHAEAQGLAEQLRLVQKDRDVLRAQLDSPSACGGGARGAEDRAEARRRDRDLRAHLAAATAAAKRGELVLADVQADVDARLEVVANRMAAETVRAKVLEMQVRSFGLAPASEVPGVFESVEVGGDVAEWRNLVEKQAREIEESAATWWVAMHDAEVAHARAVAELAEFVLTQVGGKPKEIRRGEVVDPGKMLARIRKEREADEDAEPPNPMAAVLAARAARLTARATTPALAPVPAAEPADGDESVSPLVMALDPGFKNTVEPAPTQTCETTRTPGPEVSTKRPAATAAKPTVTKPVVEPVAVPVAKPAVPATKAQPSPPPRVSVDGAVRQTALLAQLMQATRAGGAAAATQAAVPAATVHAPKPAATVHAPKPAVVAVEPDRGSNKVVPAPVKPVELPPLAPAEDVLGAGFLDLDLDLGFGLGLDAGGLGLMGDM
ncbi:hypothetical protein AMAG_17208 [Allomyces macrogynus ATCC 38327]|uniref:Uncharacterized protein n=1 Tax=Allomyces macrogynus (strain ATCC 38327) TaxID=578462 RepID=A0A0L0TEA4_ALLM3|nr:hypothetical protein AMAG_17208 [Allomyces macrogynus ATCC 38327]|eukprot:KNE72991.1 hypothetical protein AMAG_17208 [Allomyces macrogynus ATCC 38327]